MDLPYPSVKNQPLHNDLNHLDKLARSILLSTKDIPREESLPRSIQKKILKAIQSDDAQKLHKILQRQAVPFTAELGPRGSRWNALHFCSKSNSFQCAEYVLKTQYQQMPEEYTCLLNERTAQGYTMLVVAVISRSHEVLEKVLELGGADIHVLDEHKMSAYQIALNYKNDRAIRLLMNYESKTKRKQYINREALAMPVEFPPSTCLQKAGQFLLTCITFGLYDCHDAVEMKQQIMQKARSEGPLGDGIDYVAIKSQKQLPGYEVQWRRAVELMRAKVSIFDSYNPFEILEPNFTIKNNLIIFQSLTQQSWLVRRAIKAERCKNNNYNVHLYPGRMLLTLSIDDHIPFIKERNEPMFLCNHLQLWPVLLQKALAKHHKSYFAVAGIEPAKLVEEITGFPTVEISLASLPGDKIVSFFQETASKNYLYLLRGRKGTDLCEDEYECFTVLNFYERDSQSLVLLNCPFISEKWKLREKDEAFALKLIKSYYNTHRQMCVWVDASKLGDYCESVIVSLTLQNTERLETKVKAKNFVFLKFKVENKRQQNIVFQLSNTKTGEILNLSQMQVFREQGKYVIDLSNDNTKKFSPTLAEIEHLPGQYMCCYELQPSQEQVKSLLLLCWAPEIPHIEYVEEELGILEWLGQLKNHFFQVQEQCVLEVVGQFSLVLLRDSTSKVLMLRADVESEDIIEGKKNEPTGFVEMVSEKNVHYCVVKKKISIEQIAFDYRNK